MKQETNIEKNYYGDQAPTWKDFLVVIMVFLLIAVLSWVTYFKLGWLY